MLGIVTLHSRIRGWVENNCRCMFLTYHWAAVQICVVQCLVSMKADREELYWPWSCWLRAGQNSWRDTWSRVTRPSAVAPAVGGRWRGPDLGGQGGAENSFYWGVEGVDILGCHCYPSTGKRVSLAFFKQKAEGELLNTQWWDRINTQLNGDVFFVSTHHSWR